jgi:hypothetical protein
MDVSLSPTTNIARDAVTPQTAQNAGQQASPPPATPLETATAVLSPAQATLVRLLSDAVRSAAALQGGLAALLPDLVQAQNLVVIPPAVRAAIANVVNTTAPLQALPSDTEITNALLKAGSPPSPGTAAPAQATAPSPPAPADIRASLQNLQQALQQWAPEGAALQPTQTSPTTLTTTGPQSPFATGATPQQPTPGTPVRTATPVPLQGAPTTAINPLPQANPSAPVAATQALAAGAAPAAQTAAAPAQVATLQLQAQAAPAPDMGDAMASLLLLQQSAKSVTQAALRPRTAATKADASAAQKADASQGATAAQPIPKTQARSLEPLSAVTRWPSNPDPAFIARTLASRTENALTQVKLVEVATQMQRTEERQGAASPEPRWSFDIPFQTPQGQSRAHFEIERDTYNKASGGKDARVWRVRFSMDIEPLGPVHTQIAIMGKNAWVSIVAERESTMRTLEAQQQALLKGFGAEDISAEIICGVGKAPARTSAASAGKLLDSAI